MKKFISEEEIGVLEDMLFKHSLNEDTGMFERNGLRWEAMVLIGLILVLIILAL